ncbi:MAG: hypothetical protein OEY61_10770 [Gammaproteobacteria bacterium]|nr:hypothetical protein [Gammaproteobacteria bacterium]
MSEQKLSKKQKLIYLLIATVIIAPLIMMTITVIKSKNVMIEQLVELNKSREQAFANVRPALLSYKASQGVFPETLKQLMPDYITSIPDVLLIPKSTTPEYEVMDLSVNYISDGNTAVFTYRRGYNHTPLVTYDVLTDTYSEEKLAEE